MFALKLSRRNINQQRYCHVRKNKSINNPKILITGAFGQIGTELSRQLRSIYGVENVISSDVKKSTPEIRNLGPYRYIDVTNIKHLEEIVAEEGVNWIIHLSSILSAVGEQNVNRAIDINIRGIENVLEVSRMYELRVFSPSSIAAFGPSTPRDNTPNIVPMRPSTIYGVSKVYLELLGEYYNTRFGVDFRSLRYPGIISSEVLPGGGTTDYAIDIFYKALTNQTYECFLQKDAELPMMYMPDCLDATLQIIQADPSLLKQRTYNVTACSFTPEQLAEEIRKHIPDFKIVYQPDFRNEIAKSWPKSLDDSDARKDWKWNHEYGIEEMTKDMLSKIGKKVYGEEYKLKQK